jgi:hypothetical protein
MRMKKLTVAVAAATMAVVPATAALADGHDTAQVTVVHGVPGADGVNILAGDDVLLEGVNFTDIATTDVPAGTYAIAVSTSESADDAVIGPVDLTFDEGGLYAVVAHLSEDGEPTASVFEVNDAEGVSAFHTAAFPPVAIVAGGEIAADDVANGDDAQLDLEAGTELTGVGIAAAGSTDIALEVGDLTIPEAQRILAFAVGSPDDETLQVISTVVDVTVDDATEDDAEAPAEDAEEVEEEAPTHVDSGTGGAASDSLPFAVVALMALGLLALSAPVLAAVRKRN